MLSLFHDDSFNVIQSGKEDRRWCAGVKLKAREGGTSVERRRAGEPSDEPFTEHDVTAPGRHWRAAHAFVPRAASPSPTVRIADGRGALTQRLVTLCDRWTKPPGSTDQFTYPVSREISSLLDESFGHSSHGCALWNVPHYRRSQSRIRCGAPAMLEVEHVTQRSRIVPLSLRLHRCLNPGTCAHRHVRPHDRDTNAS